MPEYIYQAKNWLGMEERGTMKAGEAWEVAAKLRGQGLIPFSIKKIAVLQTPRDLKLPLLLSKPKIRGLMAFCRQFAIMSRSGLTALRSLQLLGKQEKNPVLKDRIGKIVLMVEEGDSLADSFRANSDIFPPFFINMIAAGEFSGNLDEILERLAEHFEKKNELQQKIKTALSYPVFMVIIIGLVCFLLITVVLPIFTNYFERMGVEVFFLTRILLAAGEMLLSNWYLFLLGLIALLFLGREALRTEKGAIFCDNFLLTVPIFGPLNRAIIIARFCRTLGTLLSSGIVLLEALTIVGKVIENKIVGAEIQVSIRGIMEGKPLAALLGAGIFPPMVTGMINVGEQTGTLDNMLFKAAVFYEAEAAHKVENLSSLLEPVLIGILSVVIAFIALTILYPIYDAFQLVL
jgi:type IV pilus assembly protein PilC